MTLVLAALGGPPPQLELADVRDLSPFGICAAIHANQASIPPTFHSQTYSELHGAVKVELEQLPQSRRTRLGQRRAFLISYVATLMFS